MPSLVIEKGNDKGKSVPVSLESTTIIGRDSSTALPLRDTMASRMHCKIEVRDEDYWLHDLESMNGTYLNGSKLRGEPVRLSYGDLIKVGETLLTFLSDDSSSATTLSGQRIGGYRIIERVGRGGMGTVYRAEQIDLQRFVALKVISEEHTKQKDFIELFIHEARAAAKLNHPNIVQVYDVKRHSDLYYFSMEFVSGGSVQDILNKQRRIPVDESVRTILDAARGLEYAHKKGIIHRDIKPDNLFFSETGMVKIGDMGLARGLGEKVGPEEETSVIGTPHYIAPEQVLGKDADFRSDMYSLGATMYRMLAGVTPHSAPSVRELVNKKVREDAVALQEHNAEVPKQLAHIVARMMARDPERRYETMTDVIAALEKFQRGLGDGGATVRRERPVGLGALRENKPLLVGGAALVAAAFIVILIVAFSGGEAVVNPGPNPAPNGNGGYDPNLARQMLENIKTDESRRMVLSDPRSIQKIIDKYGGLIKLFPGSREAEEAEERRRELTLKLRENQSAERLKEVEARDVANFATITQAIRGGSVVLTPAQATLQEYKSFMLDPLNRDTQSVIEASARAGHIERWIQRVGEQRSKYLTMSNKVSKAKEEGRYKVASDLMVRFRQQTARAALECDFSEDRYRSVLYEALIDAPLKEVVEAAEADWKIKETQARQLAAGDDLEGAIALLEEVIARSVRKVANQAVPLRDGYRFEIARRNRAKKAREDIKKKKELEASRKAYVMESLAVRALVVQFKMKEAVRKMQDLRDTNMDDALKSRLERRTAELKRVLELKETLINVINAPGAAPFGFKREFTTMAGQAGAVEAADEKAFIVELEIGGSIAFQWDSLEGIDGLYKFVKAHWKYSREQQSRDSNEQCNLAAYCMEQGLYEEALKELDVVLVAMKDPRYPVTDAVRKFAEEYTDRILNGKTVELEEVEAEKRLLRLDRFMDMETDEGYALAKAEIKILRNRYGDTTAVERAASRIDAHIESIPEGNGMRDRTRKDASYRALQKRVSQEQAASRKTHADVVLRLTRIDDVFLRNIHLGTAYAAAGEWRKSVEKFDEARRQGVQRLEKEKGSEFRRVLGTVYAELLRNLLMLKDQKNAELVRNEASRFFVTPENAEEEWWVSLRNWADTWSESVYPGALRRLPQQREDVRSNPEDPQKIWELGHAYHEGLQDLREARGYFAYLMDVHPEFAQVANGNCLWRLAEIHFQSRDIPKAEQLYRRLERDHADHQKVADSVAPDSVKSRLEDCSRLKVEMNYAERRRR